MSKSSSAASKAVRALTVRVMVLGVAMGARFASALMRNVRVSPLLAGSLNSNRSTGAEGLEAMEATVCAVISQPTMGAPSAWTALSVRPSTAKDERAVDREP